ncbi:APC family permease [Colwelliaceae bacterium 6441]
MALEQAKGLSSQQQTGKNLGLIELIAIALGGMVGGGIFTILGISVDLIGVYTPLAILIGGILAFFAAYSYVKLALYYQDEGATYSFFKKTFPQSPFAASLIGWWVIFGYISTLALYAYTFSAYAISAFSIADNELIRKAVAGCILLLFTIVNLWSVKGMGKIEDVMVYSKLIILAFIAYVLLSNSQTTLPELIQDNPQVSLFSILLVASLTFVAYEGFQLVINAVNETQAPEVNIPRAIYSALIIAIVIYVVIALGAIVAIPFDDIISNKEYALASGTESILGHWGISVVIFGALLATSSAISGTIFGASRQVAVIANDGYFPAILSKRKNHIPIYAIISMSAFAFLLVCVGNLTVILEFGSVTFLLVSLLMAYANFKIRDLTDASYLLSILAMICLFTGTALIFYYEWEHQPEQLFFIITLYLILTIASWIFTKKHV